MELNTTSQSQLSDRRIRKKNKWWIFVSALIMLAIGLGALTITKDAQPQNAASDMQALEQNELVLPPLPSSLTFAGENVPLDVYWVREALEREVINVVYNHSRTIQIILRTGRFFPQMSQILNEEGISQDFLYLCVAESSLEQVVSPAKAAGFWQFMETTGKKYGLEIRDEMDERYDVEKSTRAACKYLKNNYKMLESWTLAAAGYNMGETGVKNALKQQSSNNYWDLYLNTETSRYIYRILAYKVVMENKELYHIDIAENQLHKPIPTRNIAIDTTINDLYLFAQQNSVTYRELKTLNPWLRSTKLTVSGKKYTILLPAEAVKIKN
ncbi:MAG: lytic transglycosylase domain-containing protein [Bacteroidales bacterium]|nr:lytic transglycosylase domain-containing protein [Bacteroidales bacterium]